MKIIGLTKEEVDSRVAAGQVNVANSSPNRRVIDIFLTNIITPFNILIVVLAITVTFVDGSVFNSFFGVIVAVNSGVGIIQELRAKRILDELAILSAPIARVIRDGQEHEIAVDEVVLGDTLYLKLGDQVVADGKLIETSDIEIDESLLTGESDPIAKRVGQLVLSGSIVVAGSGYIEVTAVGADAYQSKIVEKAKRFKRTHSELIHGTNLLLKWISWILVVVAPLLLWGQLRLDLGNWREAIIHATAAIIGMIPEGLVLLTSIAFMLAMMTLAKQKVLVQQMPAVEGLARVDVLLLDKTGTLTDGNIRFEAVVEVNAKDKDVVEKVLATMAHRASSPTNNAILGALSTVKILDFSEEVPFSSARKWSSITVADKSWILGAPEVLFGDKTDKKYIEARRIASEGKRVLVLMSSSAKPQRSNLPSGLKPCALVVLSEKIRPDAPETINYFMKQGVEIKIISGDSPLTVAAVARQIGLVVEEPFDARDLPEDEDALIQIVKEHNVFGRVQPEQKRQIAKILQSEGRVVAMTGDGVNDALALKDADIGIAMNSGAQATKAVAELVLLDDKFTHLPSVLGEGRRVIANIERAANLFVIKNVYSLVLSLSVTIMGMNYPYLPVQMSVISALTIGTPAFFFALAPNKQRYKPGFLKRVLRFAVPVGVISALCMMANYALVWHKGVSYEEAGTSTSIVLMILSMWVLICLAHPLRGWKLGLVVLMMTVFVTIIAVPSIAEQFSYRLSLGTLFPAFVISAVGVLLIGLVRKANKKTLVSG